MDGVRTRVIAVDFDGCLCENAWPDIGEAKQDVIDALLSRQKTGAKLILWTCRVGERLDAAVSWCAERGIVFDTINENLPVNIAAFGNDSRKVYADEYWDDKAYPIGRITDDNDVEQATALLRDTIAKDGKAFTVETILTAIRRIHHEIETLTEKTTSAGELLCEYVLDSNENAVHPH